MLAHVKRQEMLTLAYQAAKAVPRTAGAQADAIKGIHMEADSRRSMITLTAIRTSMAASVEESGSCVVSASLFPEVIAKLPEEDVDLETGESSRLTIRSGNSCFHLDVLPGDRYPMPELPFPDDTLPVSGLCSLARNTVFAAAEVHPASHRPRGPEGVRLQRFLRDGGRRRQDVPGAQRAAASRPLSQGTGLHLQRQRCL